MTKQEFNKLKTGDIIQHESGNTYQVAQILDPAIFKTKAHVTRPYVEILLVWSNECPGEIGCMYWACPDDLAGAYKVLTLDLIQ